MSIIDKIPVGVVNIAGGVIEDAFGKSRQQYNPTLPDKEIDPRIGMQGFLADLRERGISKNNRHLIEFVLPKSMTDNWSSLLMRGMTENLASNLNHRWSKYMTRPEVIARSCESLSFPGHTIQTSEARFQNTFKKFPYVRNYNDVNLVFRVDGEMMEKKMFDVWSFSIIDPIDGSVGYKDSISTDIKIYQYDEDQRQVYEITLIGAFPVSISDLDSNYSGQADYHRLNVTMTFDSIRIKDVSEPFYRKADNTSAQGTKPLTVFDRIEKEIFDVGKNVVIREVGKKTPVGTIPGLGSIGNILNRL